MKKKYISPEIELVRFTLADVLTYSDPFATENNGYNNDPIVIGEEETMEDSL